MAQSGIKEHGSREMDAPTTELDERTFQRKCQFVLQRFHLEWDRQLIMYVFSEPEIPIYPFQDLIKNVHNHKKPIQIRRINLEVKKLLDLLDPSPGLPVSWKPMSTDNCDGQLSRTQVGFLGTIFTLLLALAFGILTSCRDVYPYESHNGATTDLAIARITYIISGTVMGVLSSLILTYLALMQFPRGGQGPFYLKCLLLFVMCLVLFILILLLCSLL